MPSLRLDQNIFELEPLEIRRLLTTAVIDDVDGHRLHIIGSGSADSITVNRNNAGRITVDSTPGHGTTFRITLPTARVRTRLQAVGD